MGARESWDSVRKRVRCQNREHRKSLGPLANVSPRDRGMVRGRMVHEQLQVYGMDQFCGTRLFTEVWGRLGTSGHPPHPYTVAALDALSHLDVRLACSELMIINPRVPVATAIDLVGWHVPTGITVLVEIKTGSAHRAYLGTGPMRGVAGAPLALGGLGLSNSPWSQALVQLACMYGTVQGCYGMRSDRLLALLLWVDDEHGVRTKWLHQSMAKGGAEALLGDLRRFSETRSRKPRRRNHHRLR